MGGTLGNPIDEATQNRINSRIQEILTTFGAEFSKAYTQAVIEKAKSEVSPETSIEDDMQLEDAPVPSQVLKTGILTKRGESVKNWKQRYFIAYNAADNYKIEYLDGTDEKGKLKGTIYPAGYYAYEFNQDDIAEHGEPGIKLVPWSYRRRTWWIKCADEKERKEWLSVFEKCCYKSRPPRDEDDCIADAFDVALRNTRWRCWVWGWYSDAGAEAERLGEFILDVLDRDILNEIIGGIAEGPAKALTIDLIRKTIGTSVKAACSTAWTTSASAIRGVSGKIQSQVKDMIAPIIEKQNELKDKIVEKISGKINPFLSDKGAALLRPVLNVVFKPVINSFANTAKNFHALLSAKINEKEFADNFDSALSRCDWQLDWYSGPNHSAYYLVWKMYTSDMAELLSILSGGITPSTIYNIIMDKIRLLLRRGIYTFGKLAKSVNPSEYLSVLSHVMGLFFHDVYLFIKDTVLTVLKSILDGPIQENVVTPCQELISPIQEIVDAIPIPGLSTLLDLPTLLGDVVGSIEDEALNALVSGSLGDIKTTLTSASLEIGVKSISLE